MAEPTTAEAEDRFIKAAGLFRALQHWLTERTKKGLTPIEVLEAKQRLDACEVAALLALDAAIDASVDATKLAERLAGLLRARAHQG